MGGPGRVSAAQRALVLAAALLLRQATVTAQEPSSVPSPRDSLEEVIVTGSRLPAFSDVPISPVTSISGAQIAATGLTRLEDVLNTQPMFFASMTANDFTPNFPLKLMAKDLGYAIQEGAKIGVTVQTAAPALEIFKHAAAEGLGDQDFSAVVKSFAKH